MITNFELFGFCHLASLLVPVLLGVGFIAYGLCVKSDAQLRNQRLFLAALIVLIRGARYMMDIYYGVFEWTDLISLHICHIDLILLVACLIRPRKSLFQYCFLIGIPTALSVALFPGTHHPAPGMPRAVLFIMSHMMLVIGAVYLVLVLHMKPTFKACASLAFVGSLCLVPVYWVNSALHTNYLYIMTAPPGTVIETLDKLFGWPGYVFAIDMLAVLLMLGALGLGQLLWKMGKPKITAAVTRDRHS